MIYPDTNPSCNQILEYKRRSYNLSLWQTSDGRTIYGHAHGDGNREIEDGDREILNNNELANCGLLI
jgi:hypothetical protein